MENNRLQFRHCNKIFDTREDAINYINVGIKFNPDADGLAYSDTSHRYQIVCNSHKAPAPHIP